MAFKLGVTLGQKQKQGEDRMSNRTRQNNKGADGMMESNDNSEGGDIRRDRPPLELATHKTTVTSYGIQTWHDGSLVHGRPEGRPGSSDVSPLPEISGLSFDSISLSAPLLFCLVLLLILSSSCFCFWPSLLPTLQKFV